MAIRLILFLLFSCGYYASSLAQLNYTIKYSKESSEVKNLNKQLEKSNANELEQNARTILYQSGFLEAIVSLDSATLNAPAILNISTGKQYSWVELSETDLSAFLPNKQRYNFSNFSNEKLNPQELTEYMENLINYYENHGFPFAQCMLDSIIIRENGVYANLIVESGPRITIDSIQVIGTSKVSEKYIANYIGLKPNTAYSEEKFKAISKRIDELPFLSQPAPAEMQFKATNTTLLLALNKEKANDFNGILGFQPDANSSELVVTGDIKLKLLSAFGKGESIDIRWRRLQTQTQDIKLHVNLPYLLNSPIGADLLFSIYRRDTTFSTITAKAGLPYNLTGGDYFEANVTFENSNLISTEPYENSTTLPEVADVSFIHYGVTYETNKLDYRLNPRKGFKVKITGSVGEKEIRRNAALENVNYDSLALKSTQYTTQLDASVFIPIIKKATIHYRAQGGYLENDLLFTNELFRLGGLNSIRGFDEESIFASAYLIQSLEVRYLLEKNAFTYLFFDFGLYENQSINTSISDTPYGFGGGVSFETKAGIFSVNYALGSQFHQAIDLRSGKIHFGFVSYF